MLIGGLGMGFTLAAALEVLPANASVLVAELVPKVLDWAKGPLAHMFGDMLNDPRVAVNICDVHDMIKGSFERFDAILLDVDNGPDFLIHAGNEALYAAAGLRSAYARLAPAGVLAVWCQAPSAPLLAALRGLDPSAEETHHRVQRGERTFTYAIATVRRPHS